MDSLSEISLRLRLACEFVSIYLPLSLALIVGAIYLASRPLVNGDVHSAKRLIILSAVGGLVLGTAIMYWQVYIDMSQFASFVMSQLASIGIIYLVLTTRLFILLAVAYTITNSLFLIIAVGRKCHQQKGSSIFMATAFGAIFTLSLVTSIWGLWPCLIEKAGWKELRLAIKSCKSDNFDLGSSYYQKAIAEANVVRHPESIFSVADDSCPIFGTGVQQDVYICRPAFYRGMLKLADFQWKANRQDEARATLMQITRGITAIDENKFPYLHGNRRVRDQRYLDVLSEIADEVIQFYVKRHDYKGALKTLDLLDNSYFGNSRRALLKRERAICLNESGQYLQAASLYLAHPTELEFEDALNLAKLEWDSGHSEVAHKLLASVARALALRSNKGDVVRSTTTWAALGYICQSHGDSDTGWRYFSDFIADSCRNKSDSTDLWQVLTPYTELAISRKQTAQAVRAVDSIINRFGPGSHVSSSFDFSVDNAVCAKARLLYAEGKAQDANATLQKLLTEKANYENDHEKLLAIGRIYIDQGEYEKAKNVYDAAWKAVEKQWSSRGAAYTKEYEGIYTCQLATVKIELAVLYLQMGKKELAEKNYQDALAMFNTPELKTWKDEWEKETQESRIRYFKLTGQSAKAQTMMIDRKIEVGQERPELLSDRYWEM